MPHSAKPEVVARRPSDAPASGMWVRACRQCGRVDFSAAWGDPALVPDSPWCCRRCRDTRWRFLRLAPPRTEDR